ncbi:hypothetical protein J6590_047717 [Homalodisca vitripennis]|nr:hypothetical protein J6590_047717 [Homalodisca vitripennis]
MGLLAFAVVTGVGSAIIALPVLAPAVLPLIGFSAVGPVAGGLAAGAQAFVGNVAAGSTFATLQAMAMAAPTPAMGPVAGGLAAGAQAFVGNVAAGSVFATLQAMAMAAPTLGQGYSHHIGAKKTLAFSTHRAVVMEAWIPQILWQVGSKNPYRRSQKTKKCGIVNFP